MHAGALSPKLAAVTTEIERKFVLPDVPGAGALGPGVRLRQGYLALDGEVQVRLRLSGSGALLTVKAGTGLSRTEVEVPLDGAAAEALWPHTEGRRVEKVRHRLPVGGHTVDVDVYEGPLGGLCTAEVEFASTEEAAGFEPPPWFGRDVTGEAGWDNASLALHGRPG